MAETTASPMCPMAKMCEGMMNRPKSGFLMSIPGLVLIIFGMAIILYPKILVWLIGIALIAMGLAMLTMVNFMRNSGKRA